MYACGLHWALHLANKHLLIPAAAINIDYEDQATEILLVVFNGPVVAGIGVTTDVGLTADKHHDIPWDPINRTQVGIEESSEGGVMG